MTNHPNRGKRETMSKHTPGPWELLPLHGVIVSANSDGTIPLNSRVIARLTECYPANSSLIVASPILLGACKAIVARVNGDYSCPELVAFGPLSTDAETDCKDIARAAIAKAEGVPDKCNIPADYTARDKVREELANDPHCWDWD